MKYFIKAYKMLQILQLCIFCIFVHESHLIIISKQRLETFIPIAVYNICLIIQRFKHLYKGQTYHFLKGPLHYW